MHRFFLCLTLVALALIGCEKKAETTDSSSQGGPLKYQAPKIP